MRPGAKTLIHTAFGLLMAVGGSLVAVAPAAATTTPATDSLPHTVGGFTTPTTQLKAGQKIGVFAALPAGASVQSDLPPVGDQGAIGSCVAWTVAHSMMGYYAKRDGGSGAPYAPLYLYMRVVPKGGAPNSGLNPASALQEAAANGVDTQDDYVQGTANYSVAPTVSEVVNASNYKVTSWSTLFSGQTGQGVAAETAIKTAIAGGAPVGIGMPVYKDFMYLTGNTLYNSTAGTNLGGHMVTAYAYDAEGLWIRNQWGTTWGNNGDAHLAWSFVDSSIWAAYTMTGVTTPSKVAVARPVVSTISQVRGPVAGGTEVVITGGNLANATAVRFGDTAANFTKREVNGVTSLVAVAPAHNKGIVDVTVSNAAGPSALNAQARFQYMPPAPVITKLSVVSTSVLGGETVTITGTNFEDTSAVRIGNTVITSMKVVSGTTITLLTPTTLPAAIYDVSVTTPSGTTVNGPADKLAVVNPPTPTIIGLNVSTGPTYTTTPVTITGTNLGSVKGVSVSGVPVTYQRLSDSQLKVTMPVHAAGKVTIRIVTLGGTVEGTAVPFTYVAPAVPAVNSMTPTSGGVKTYTAVELTGVNFGMVDKVTADGVSVTFAKISDNKLKVYLPPHAAGTVKLQVSNPGGASTAATTSTFTYKA